MTEPSYRPPPPPQPYANDTSAPVIRPQNGLGTAALVIAIAGLILGLTIVGGIILGITAVAVGFAARGRVKQGKADNGGVAMAGIVLGFIAIVMGFVAIPIWLAIFRDTVDCLDQAGNDDAKVQQCADDFRGKFDSTTVTLTPSAVAL